MYCASAPKYVVGVKEDRFFFKKNKNQEVIFKAKSQHFKLNFKYLRDKLILEYLGNSFSEQRQYHQMQNFSKISWS